MIIKSRARVVVFIAIKNGEREILFKREKKKEKKKREIERNREAMLELAGKSDNHVT